jgi:hypothetical protein
MNILTGIALLFFLLPWQVAIAAILIWPVVLVGPRLVAPHAAAAAARKRLDESAVLSTVTETLATSTVVRAFNLESYARRRFLERLTPLTTSTVQATFYGLFAERTTVITIYFERRFVSRIPHRVLESRLVDGRDRAIRTDDRARRRRNTAIGRSPPRTARCFGADRTSATAPDANGDRFRRRGICLSGPRSDPLAPHLSHRAR